MAVAPHGDMRGLLVAGLLMAVAGCGPPRTAAPEAAPAPPPQPAPVTSVGKASWYGAFHHGRRTASGEIFDMHALTAAHRTLPLGTRVQVTNLANGRSVVVRVNDRGPAIQSRIIDVSRGVARALDAVAAGVFPVEIVVMGGPETPRQSRSAARSPDTR